MDELYIRFSHLSEKIFDSLDDDSIIKCKEASRFWFNYLDGQKLVQIKQIIVKTALISLTSYVSLFLFQGLAKWCLFKRDPSA